MKGLIETISNFKKNVDIEFVSSVSPFAFVVYCVVPCFKKQSKENTSAVLS